MSYIYICITTNILNTHEHLVIITMVTRCHQRWLANPGKNMKNAWPFFHRDQGLINKYLNQELLGLGTNKLGDVTMAMINKHWDFMGFKATNMGM